MQRDRAGVAVGGHDYILPNGDAVGAPCARPHLPYRLTALCLGASHLARIKQTYVKTAVPGRDTSWPRAQKDRGEHARHAFDDVQRPGR